MLRLLGLRLGVGRLACGLAVFFQQLSGLIWLDRFVEIIIDEAYRASATGGQTLGEFDRPLPAGRDGDGVVMRITLGSVNACQLADTLHEFCRSCHGAREGAANAEVILARSVLAKTWIKRNYLVDLHRFEIQLGGNPFRSLRGDKPKMVLDNVQQRKHSGTFPVIWILGDALVRFRVDLSGYVKRRK